MGYSSVQYLSNQFRLVTGLTVSEYIKSVARKKAAFFTPRLNFITIQHNPIRLSDSRLLTFVVYIRGSATTVGSPEQNLKTTKEIRDSKLSRE